MSDPISELASYGDFDEGETRDRWVARYIIKPPEFRIESLKIMDQWIEREQQEHSRPTRELANKINFKRELEDIHWRLRRAGR